MTGYQKLKAENDYLWKEIKKKIIEHANLISGFTENAKRDFIEMKMDEVILGAWKIRHGKEN